jgi:hypothetical protein
MDADLARLVRGGEITRKLAEQRAAVPEELKRLIGSGGIQQPTTNAEPVAAVTY